MTYCTPASAVFLFLEVAKMHNANLELRISQDGIELIKRFEGLRLRVYKDVARLPTTGYGHLIKSGEHFAAGITEKQAEQMLVGDLVSAQDAVKKWVKVALTQGQFDALVSFVFNVGEGNLMKSTLLRKLNDGEVAGAAEELLKWDKAGGKVVEGLVRRRVAESKRFVGDDFC
ncbi:lysozyme [Gammaproteobacteria bacterium]